MSDMMDHIIINIKSWIKVCGLSLVLFLNGCAGTTPSLVIPKTPPPAPIISPSPNVAVVLGGGGARGYAHIGVLIELQKAHIPIDLVVGASAGSLMGVLYADQGSAQAVADAAMPAGFWDFADIAAFPAMGGVVKGYHLEKFLMKNLHAKTFSELSVPFVAVTTDLTTGETFPISSGPIPPAILASSAVPSVIKPVNLYERVLVDGGVADNVPVDIARTYHPKIIIAVDIGTKLSDDMPHSAFGIAARSYQITSDRLTHMQLAGTAFVIRPDVGQVGMFDLSHNLELVHAGQQAAYDMIPAIKQALKDNGIVLLR